MRAKVPPLKTEKGFCGPCNKPRCVKTCHKQYTGSTEKFQSRFNTYRCSHRNFLRNKKVKQESFHAHFTEGLHQGESDWEVRLIDRGFSVDDVRRRESYWQHELDKFQPNGLNEREVSLF